MEVVILCGGKGTRLKEETEFKPKPLVTIGGKPIVWHIMKLYSHYGHNDFILALGYKGNLIKEYFLNLREEIADFKLNMKTGQKEYYDDSSVEDWNITFAETGLESGTANRLKQLQKYIKGDNFMLTYGDGVADINMPQLIDHHNRTGAIVTITGVNPITKFGIVKVEGDFATEMKEKPLVDSALVNGGFMVINRQIFDHIDNNPSSMLVDITLPQLAQQGKLAVYLHKGFWHCMDTYRDHEKLNQFWKQDPQWKIWK